MIHKYNLAYYHLPDIAHANQIPNERFCSEITITTLELNDDLDYMKVAFVMLLTQT